MESRESREKLSPRSYQTHSRAHSWEEIWEAGPYYHRVSDLLENAKKYVVFVGWQIDSRLRMPKPHSGLSSGQEPVRFESLKEKVLRLCAEKPQLQIYFLIWDHAYFYTLERENWQGRVWDEIHPRVHFVFDNRHALGGSHHEKVCLIDGKFAFCGGIDLCDERWDSEQHLYSDPRRSLSGLRENHGPYHDLAVQVSGPVCADIHEHIALRWRKLSTIPFPTVAPHLVCEAEPGHPVYFSRTQSSPGTLDEKPKFVRETEFLFRDLILSAQSRIILEGQYFWSKEVNDLLIAKAHQMRGKPFQIILILAELHKLKSLSRQMSSHQLLLLEKLYKSTRFSDTELVIAFPYVFPDKHRNPLGTLRAKPVYIHSKLLIIDNRYLCIGSANFASRALRLDTEISLTLEGKNISDQNHIHRVAEQVLRHWDFYGDRPESHLALRIFKPRSDLRHSDYPPWLQMGVRWDFFFDPALPWSFTLKNRIRKIYRSGRFYPIVLFTGVWLLGGVLTSLLSFKLTGINPSQTTNLELRRTIITYACLLASSWAIPYPFLLVAILSVMHLGGFIGTRIVVSSLWISSILGYGIARYFPATSRRYQNQSGLRAPPAWLDRRMGVRSFGTLIAVLTDFRVSLKNKIAYPGLYSVPLPWFILGSLIYLPGVFYFICRVTAHFSQNFGPFFVEKWSLELISLGVGLAALTVLRGHYFNRKRAP